MRIDTGVVPLPVIGPPPLRPTPPAPEATSPASSASFADLLGSALRRVNDSQLAAQQAMERVTTGEAETLHEAIVAVETADLALRLTAGVTQRAVAAYQEIARMQI